jgi:tetratricopeptide (TPR) repeat protein
LLVGLGLIVLVFNTILAPSPEAIARVEAENDAMTAFEAGNYERALVTVEQGLAVVPNDPGLLILKGIFQELLAEDVAIQSFEQAKANLDELTSFYLGRGQMYFRTNQYVKAENDATAALELNENISIAWLLLGQSLESQGREFEAIPAYQQAGEVALSNGDSEVVVLARLALSRVGISPIVP